MTGPTAEQGPPVDGQVPAHVPAQSPMSDIPSMEPRNIGHGPESAGYTIDDFLTGRPSADLDLVTKSYMIPRYLAEALRLENMKTRRPHQAIVADALRAHLPAALVEHCRRRAEGR